MENEEEGTTDQTNGRGKDDDTESTTQMEDSDGESLVGEPKGEIKEPYHIAERDEGKDTDKKGEGQKGLTDEAQMNIICDEVAGDTTKAMLEGGVPPEVIVLEPPYEGSKAMLRAGGRWVTSKYKQEIYRAHRLDPMKQYCKEKYGMTESIFNSIHWASVGSVRSRLSQTRFMQTAKIMHGWLPIGHMRKHVTANATCPACGHPDETIQHMMKCPATRMRRKREEVLKAALERGIKKRIPRHVMEAFCRILKYEMGDTERAVSEMADNSIRRAVQAQQDIGLRYMCRGYLAREWIVVMKEAGTERIEQKMNALQDIVWFVIFDGIWETRNEILHKQENYYGREEESKLNTMIRWYVDHKYEVLQWGDQFLANIDLTRLQHMRRETKRKWIKHVEMARRRGEIERRQRRKNQTVLTSYFKVMTRKQEPDLGLDPG